MAKLTVVDKEGVNLELNFEELAALGAVGSVFAKITQVEEGRSLLIKEGFFTDIEELERDRQVHRDIAAAVLEGMHEAEREGGVLAHLVSGQAN